MNEFTRPFLELVIFFLSVFISFYSPGRLFSGILKLKLNFLEDVFFNITFGIIIFSLITYGLYWLKASSIILPVLILIFLLVLIGQKFSIRIKFKDLIPLFLIFIGSLIFSLTMLTSGQFGESMRFVGINQSDSFWHLSLINELKNNFPPDNPGFSGVPLKGYHFFFNLVLAQISKLFSLSPLSLYFHFFPLLISFLWGLGVFVLVKNWTNNKGISYLAVFLSFFGGSFSFVLPLLGHKAASLDDAFGITQPASSLVNPPFSVSVVLLIAFLFSLLKYLGTKNKGWLLPVLLIAGSAAMFKIYLGILLFSGLVLLTFWDIINRKFTFLLVTLCAFSILAATYGVFRDPTSRIFFDPLWSPNRMVEANLPWFGFAEKYNLYIKRGALGGLVKIETFALAVFVAGSLGTRIIGLIYFIPSFLKRRMRYSTFNTVLAVMTLTSIIIPLFFIQSGKVFEMIQMTWYFLFLTSLAASVGLYRIAKKLNFNILLVVLFFALTIPSAYEKISFYITYKGETLSKDYIESANFLKRQGNYNSTVLKLPSASTYIGINTTKEDVSSWFYGSTPKLLALSNKRGYVSNEFINFFGADYNSRLPIIVSIIKYEDSEDYQRYFSEIHNTLKNSSISYIYSPRPLLRLEKTNIIQRVFQNSAAFIYKVTL